MAAINYTKTDIRDVHTAPGLEGKEDIYFSTREKMFVVWGAPRTKASISGTYNWLKWNTGLRLAYFGHVESGTWSQLDDPDSPNQYYDPRLTADIHVGYQINKNLAVIIGGANIFDAIPTEQDPNETENGALWENVQMGINGASYFLRLSYNLSMK